MNFLFPILSSSQVFVNTWISGFYFTSLILPWWHRCKPLPTLWRTWVPALGREDLLVLINPKSHGTCGFTFHLGSGSAHRSVDPLLRVSAGEGAEGRPLWPRASLLYCCRNLSLAFPHDSEARQIDFHGRIKEQFFFSCLRAEINTSTLI